MSIRPNRAAVVIVVSIFVIIQSSEGIYFGVDCLVSVGWEGVRCPPSAWDSKGTCIKHLWICNGPRTCLDGFDEEYGCRLNTYPNFQCNNGTLIHLQNVCDHIDDCGDESDEQCEGYAIPISAKPATATTGGPHFGGDCLSVDFGKGIQDKRAVVLLPGLRCPPSEGDIHGMCLHRVSICDGEKQCPDGFDETRCDGCPQNRFRCSNDQCIDSDKVCDHFDDCGDGSDEMCEGYLINPTNTTTIKEEASTERSQFGENCTFFSVTWLDGRQLSHGVRCPPSPGDVEGRCIHRNWICNGTKECSDGFDEAQCGVCPFQHFRCSNGRCIMNNKLCNHFDDCGDGSDEMCGKHFGGKCTGGGILCPPAQNDSLDECIQREFICDWNKDCHGGFDESSCGKFFGGRCILPNGRKGIRCQPTAGESEGKCILREYVCDGEKDCQDGYDETRCEGCRNKEIRCSNGTCIDAEKLCDNRDDCGDRSDELCEGCPKYQFRCRNGRCVDNLKVCDHRDDCGDKSDEMCDGYLFSTITTTTTTAEVIAACRDPPVPIGGSVTFLPPQRNSATNAAANRRGAVGTRIARPQAISSIPFSGNAAVLHAVPEAGPIDLGPGLHAIESRAIFKCVSHYYTLLGPRTRRCQGQGEWSGRSSICNPVCGQSDEGRLPSIVNGKTTDVGQWPWQVAISRQLAAAAPSLSCNDGWCLLCGGSLLSETWVVTAAHCVTYEDKTVPLDEGSFRVYLGKHFRDDRWDDELVQVRQVREVHVHENFHPKTFDSDIALLQLDSPVQLNSRVQPICLPTQLNLFDGKEGVVTGWGDLYGNKTYSQTLQQAVLPVVISESCRKAYKDAKTMLTVTDNMFCAGLKEGQRDGCEGDSGGPMVFYSSWPTPRWVLEGIVSWGSHNGCAIPGQYGGFTAVYRFLDWIHLFI